MATTIMQGKWPAERVRSLRLLRGESVEEFARSLDVAPRSVYAWEHGQWQVAHYAILRRLDALARESGLTAIR